MVSNLEVSKLTCDECDIIFIHRLFLHFYKFEVTNIPIDIITRTRKNSNIKHSIPWQLTLENNSIESRIKTYIIMYNRRIINPQNYPLTNSSRLINSKSYSKHATLLVLLLLNCQNELVPKTPTNGQSNGSSRQLITFRTDSDVCRMHDETKK